MPSENRSSVVNEDELDSMIRDWAELFELFQDRTDLVPHHNVEVKDLLTQKDMLDSGRIIYYNTQDTASFHVSYNYEWYREGDIARGIFEPRDAVKELYPADSDKRQQWTGSEAGLIDQTYLLADITEDSSLSKLEAGFVIPRDYDQQKVLSTIDAGQIVVNEMMSEICRLRKMEDPPTLP